MVAERRRRELAGDTAGQGTKASLDTMKKRYSHTASNTVGSRGSIIRAKARHGANQNRTRPTILSRDSWKEWQSCWGRRPPREKPKMLKPIPLYVASSNDNQGNRRILPRRTTIPRRGRFMELTQEAFDSRQRHRCPGNGFQDRPKRSASPAPVYHSAFADEVRHSTRAGVF